MKKHTRRHKRNHIRYTKRVSKRGGAPSVELPKPIIRHVVREEVTPRAKGEKGEEYHNGIKSVSFNVDSHILNPKDLANKLRGSKSKSENIDTLIIEQKNEHAANLIKLGNNIMTDDAYNRRLAKLNKQNTGVLEMLNGEKSRAEAEYKELFRLNEQNSSLLNSMTPEMRNALIKNKEDQLNELNAKFDDIFDKNGLGVSNPDLIIGLDNIPNYPYNEHSAAYKEIANLRSAVISAHRKASAALQGELNYLKNLKLQNES